MRRLYPAHFCQRNLNNMLTKGQCDALNLAKEGRSVFISGPGGVGKTHVVSEIISFLEGKKKNIAKLGSTGKSICNINGGQTLHSFLGFGLCDQLKVEMIQAVTKGKKNKRKQRWVEIDVLFLEEISMIDPLLLYRTDQVARASRGIIDKPFGGLQLIFCGDFAQLPPVMKRPPVDERKMDDIEKLIIKSKLDFAFELPMWKSYFDRTVILTEIMRCKDEEFVAAQSRLRLGVIIDKDVALLRTRIVRKQDSSSSATILFSKNVDIDEINDAKCRAIDSPETIFQATWTLTKKDGPKVDCKMSLSEEERTAFLLKGTKNLTVKSRLRLKVGTEVMLLSNLDIENGLINGSRGVVIKILGNPFVQFQKGEPIELPPRDWICDLGNKYLFTFKQVPLSIAYAITVHKSQGMSIDKLRIQLDKSIFMFGQAYTALSRSSDFSKLEIAEDFNPSVFKCHPKVIDYYQTIDNKQMDIKEFDSNHTIKRTKILAFHDAQKRENISKKRKEYDGYVAPLFKKLAKPVIPEFEIIDENDSSLEEIPRASVRERERCV